VIERIFWGGAPLNTVFMRQGGTKDEKKSIDISSHGASVGRFVRGTGRA
jgi:hypothetical protein